MSAEGRRAGTDRCVVFDRTLNVLTVAALLAVATGYLVAMIWFAGPRQPEQVRCADGQTTVAC